MSDEQYRDAQRRWQSQVLEPLERESAPRKRAGLSGMVLAELRELAAQLGLSGTAGIKRALDVKRVGLSH